MDFLTTTTNTYTLDCWTPSIALIDSMDLLFAEIEVAAVDLILIVFAVFDFELVAEALLLKLEAKETFIFSIFFVVVFVLFKLNVNWHIFHIYLFIID